MNSQINRREFLVASGATVGLASLRTEAAHAKAQRVRVVGLKTDHLERPLGIETHQPRLSWRLESAARNVCQSAYRIWVASSEAALASGRGDLWDSGKISSGHSIGIAYQGRALTSRQRCYWCVQVWID